MVTSPEPDLSIEPVTGWRVWRLHRTPRGLELGSVVFDDRWPPKEAFRARCEHHRTEAPQAACRCGIYAAASPEALATALGFGGPISVIGATDPTSEDASEVQAELLSTYGVDLLPLEQVADPLRLPADRPPVDPVEIAGKIGLVLIHIIGFAIQAVWILWWTLTILSALVVVGSILLGAVLRMFGLGDARVGDT